MEVFKRQQVLSFSLVESGVTSTFLFVLYIQVSRLLLKNILLNTLLLNKDWLYLLYNLITNTMTTREFMESRTQLELHLLQWFKETGEPMDIEFYRQAGDSFHCLDEFVDGYGRKENGVSQYNFDGDEELEIRINEFLKVAQEDRENPSYSISKFELITELINELGL